MLSPVKPELLQEGQLGSAGEVMGVRVTSPTRRQIDLLFGQKRIYAQQRVVFIPSFH
ncbi:hypothetical protein HRbin17_02429 [bacterium HR17]|uniref:Uncharacterized protein n=1 Tax=Candidatus Fervidibacter japonicus TaxID=2035412 RepID=A0A2H5XFH5_9BACT|nr:hypothetical protein HRbin17_02429 [bacterium HR17]